MLGRRVQRARKALGLSLRDLGDLVALSHAAIKKYEDSAVIPSSDVLLKLANALHVRVEYFFRPEHFILENIQYRKHTGISERHLQAVTAIILNKIERRVELENLFPAPPCQPFSRKALVQAVQDDHHIEKWAEQVRHLWDLGLDPILDLIDIFEAHGIKVFEVDNQLYDKFEGLYAEINGLPVIIVGNQWPVERQRFTLAHELGHILLNNRIANQEEAETICNHFAGAFLLPKTSLIASLGEYRNAIEPRELNLIKQEYGISMTSILHRAEETGVITPILYRQMRTEFNQRGWSKQEPGEPCLKRDRYVFERMILHALAEKYIGEAKAAELMEMSLAEFRSLRAME